MSYTDLGAVITVINEMPYIFGVETQEMERDSLDPHNRFRLVYLFLCKKPDKLKDNKRFVVKVDSFSGFPFNSQAKFLHNNAIKFGLYSIKKKPDNLEFIYKYKGFKETIAGVNLHEFELRDEILKFYYNVYKQWPRQPISIFDLYDNFINPEEEIRRWFDNLHDRKQIKSLSKVIEYRINRGEKTAEGYRLNAEKEEEIASLLAPKRHKKMPHAKSEDKSILVFLSYSTKNKRMAGSIKHCLEEYGLKIFLAHEDIVVSEEWQETIIKNLIACDVFVPIITDKFLKSVWTDQESGHAIKSNKVIIPLMQKGNPHGFLNKFQACKIRNGGIKTTCPEIAKAIAGNIRLSSRFRNNLIRSFGNSSDFNDAMSKTALLVSFNNYSKDQWSSILKHIKENDQIHKSNGACSNLRYFLETNKAAIDTEEYKSIMKLIGS